MEQSLCIDTLRFLSLDNSITTMYGKLGVQKNNLCYGCFNPENNKLFEF